MVFILVELLKEPQNNYLNHKSTKKKQVQWKQHQKIQPSWNKKIWKQTKN